MKFDPFNTYLRDSNPDDLGGGGAALSEAEFQGKVLDFHKKQKETTDSLVEKYDNLDKQTKQAFEELTKLKNAGTQSAEEFQRAIQKVNLQLHREMRAANGDPVKRIQADPEKRTRLNAIVRAACGAPMTPEQRTTLGEDSSPGSTMIDDDLADDIYDTLAEYGVWSTFGVRRLGTKQTKFPVKTARATAGFILSEGGAITEDTAKAGTSVTCEVEVIGSLLPVSRQLLDDSEFDVTGDVLRDFAQSAAYRLDWACLQADGGADATDGGMTGIFAGGTAVDATSGNVSVETLDFEDIVNTTLGVDAALLTRMSKWWIHPQILMRMLTIKDSNGRPIFLTATEAPSFGGIGSILGYPVIPAFAAPSANSTEDPVAAFGDPEGLVVGIRKDFEFEASDHAGFTTYERYFRGITRAGVKIRKATAFGILTTAAS